MLADHDEQLVFLTGHGDVPLCAKPMKAGAGLAAARPNSGSHEETRSQFTSNEAWTMVMMSLSREVVSLFPSVEVSVEFAALMLMMPMSA